MTTAGKVPALYASVAVPLPIATAFTYVLPQELKEKAVPGVRVRVPFRNREIIGYLVGLEAPDTAKDLKPVLEVLDDQPVLSKEMIELTKWVSTYYGSSWGEAVENALPKWVKYGKKTDKYIKKAQKIADSESRMAVPPQEFTLTPEQKNAFKTISASLAGQDPKPILLYGVTGSGKSELYIRAIHETLKKNRSVICLVPEIALTEQLKRFFTGHFGNALEILHSKMTDGERFLAWKRIEMGHCRVVLGPRSAVFAPMPDLGLIIMDEEHEGSYKQETTPRYHAREVALWRAQHEHALFLMGTATPSLESMFMAEQGGLTRLDLTQRVDQKSMPKVQIIDLKTYEHDRKRSAILSLPLMREIEHNLKHGEGTMLLLNRRGFSTSIHCPKCGQTEKCKLCQVALTFHQEQRKLLCHYCNFQKEVPEVCSSCKTPILRFAGFGTEKVESEVAKFFPKAKIARLDADTTKTKDAHETILDQFRQKKIDILIGTQMIAKGFDFPHVTFVGVILADIGLRLPDFRSSERTFQLLTQFAGRAGRGTKPGRVYIQTYTPEHPSVLFAKEHDFLNFYRHEKTFRQEFNYPPFCSLVNIIIRARDEKKAYAFAREVRDSLKKEFAEAIRSGMEIMGPAPLPFYKLRGHFRWHVMLKVPRTTTITPQLYACLMSVKKPSAVAFALDVDPLNIL